MDQPFANVTPADIERIVRRDFTSEQYAEAMQILSEYCGKETERVRAAALKMATGEIQALRREVENANCDYRDVVVAAEYPRYSREIAFDEVPAELEREVIEEDWKQYERWFSR